MCKKLCIAVGAVIVGLLVIGISPRLKSTATDVMGKIRSWNEDVSPESQLKQLHVEMKKIDADIGQHVHKLAVLKEDVDSTRTETEALAKKVENQKAEIAAMTKALDSTSEKVSFNGSMYTQSDLVKKLDRAVTTYERQKADLKARQRLLAQKTETLNVSTQRVKAMQQQKEELKVAVAELEARLEAVKSRQVDQAVEVDDSQVNKCNVLLEKARKTIAVEENAQGYRDELGLSQKPAQEVRDTSKSKADVLEATKKALQDDEVETSASTK
jgi:chromosome segregation ATPase